MFLAEGRCLGTRNATLTCSTPEATRYNQQAAKDVAAPEVMISTAKFQACVHMYIYMYICIYTLTCLFILDPGRSNVRFMLKLSHLFCASSEPGPRKTVRAMEVDIEAKEHVGSRFSLALIVSTRTYVCLIFISALEPIWIPSCQKQ